MSYFAIQGEKLGKPGVVEVRLFKNEGIVEKVQIAGSAIEAGILEYELGG